jgi:PHD/YefM family antitoxin component YafN of YafNO toxin-antitoxin module
MRIAGVREFRARLARFLAVEEPVLLTKHGKLSGVYLPLEDPDRLPDDLRRELAAALGRHLARSLESRGISEEDIQRDFDAHRRSRR